MTAALALDWFERLLWNAALVGAPPVITVVAVGLAIAVLQAATQVNDAAVAFAPKIIAIMVCMVVAGEWMLLRLRDFTVASIEAIASLTGR